MSEMVPADASGNRVTGEALLHQTTGCFVHSEDRLVSLAGVSDLLVVDTPDALLVAHKDGRRTSRSFTTGSNPPGIRPPRYIARAPSVGNLYVLEGRAFLIKRIEVRPGARLSLQAHHHRSEHWVVVSGTAKVVNGDQEILLTTNQSTYVPCGHRHRLENPGVMCLIMIEVQSGDYLGEDDIVRFDDV